MEPFAAPDEYFEQPWAYVGDLGPAVERTFITNDQPTNAEWNEQPVEVRRFLADTPGQTVVFGAYSRNFGRIGVFHVSWFAPGATVPLVDQDFPLWKGLSTFFSSFDLGSRPASSHPWRVVLEHDPGDGTREKLAEETFFVDTVGAPALRVEQLEPDLVYLIDSRVTALGKSLSDSTAGALSRSFRISNQGTAPLVIEAVELPDGLTWQGAIPQLPQQLAEPAVGSPRSGGIETFAIMPSGNSSGIQQIKIHFGNGQVFTIPVEVPDTLALGESGGKIVLRVATGEQEGTTSDDRIEVVVNGEVLRSIAKANMHGLNINGGGGADTFVIDYGNGNRAQDPTAFGAIVLLGDTGLDTLVVAADSDFRLSDTELVRFHRDSRSGEDEIEVVESRLGISGINVAELSGGSGNNLLDAQGFSDDAILSGEGGDDILIRRFQPFVSVATSTGGIGSDTLRLMGTAGTDSTPVQFFGNDLEHVELHGEEGDDELSVEVLDNSGLQTLTLFGGAGQDTLTVTGTEVAENLLLQLAGEEGDDTYVIVGPLVGLCSGLNPVPDCHGLNVHIIEEDGGGVDTLDFQHYEGVELDSGEIAGDPVRIDLADSGEQRMNTPLGPIRITLRNPLALENALGSKFPDRIYGNNNKNVLRGGDGDDLLVGRGGNDELYGEGNDVRYDLLVGDFEHFDANFGDDLLVGGTGDDVLFGDNALVIEQSSNLALDAIGDGLEGGGDMLDPGQGDDLLQGQGGSDTYRFWGSSLGADAIAELAPCWQEDALDFTHFETPSGNKLAVNLDLGSLAPNTVHPDHLTLRIRDSDYDVYVPTDMAIEKVVGIRVSDHVTAGSCDTIFEVHDIPDGTGQFNLLGGPGDDTLRLMGTAEHDSIDFTLPDGHSIENLEIFGFEGSDTITAGAFPGARVMIDGGLGADTLDVSGSQTGALLFGGPGYDTLIGSDFDDQLIADLESGVAIGRAGNDSIDLGSGAVGVAVGGYLVANQLLVGQIAALVSQGDRDRIRGSDVGNTIYGGNVSFANGWEPIELPNVADEQILDLDVIVGGPGADTVFGQEDPDFIVGGGGNDTISSGRGDDYVIGDVVTTGAVVVAEQVNGHDTLNGDDVIYGDGVTAISGDPLNVTDPLSFIQSLRAAATDGGNDTVNGGDGDDFLVGGGGNDLIWGAGGDDMIFGDHGIGGILKIRPPSLDAASGTAASGELADVGQAVASTILDQLLHQTIIDGDAIQAGEGYDDTLHGGSGK